MRQYKLYYSRLFSIPIFNELLYSLEILLLKLNCTHIFFMSSMDSFFRDIFIKLLDRNDNFITVSSIRYGRLLSRFKKAHIHLDVGLLPEHEFVADPYKVVWSVVHAASLSFKALKRNKNLLPQTLPVYQKVLITSWEKIDAPCDHIYQTASTLSQSSNKSVYLILHAYPHTPINFFEKIDFSKKIPNSVKIIRPFEMFHGLSFSWKLQKLNEMIKMAILKIQLILINPDILWTFSTEDAFLLHSSKKILSDTLCLYDCVDNYASIDAATNTRITQNEISLINNCDYFFVNSQVLAKLKNDFSVKPIIVPLGFDLTSFKKTSSVNQNESKIIAMLEEKRKKTKIVGYIGAVNYRFDFKLLLSVITRSKSTLFVFTGYFQNTHTEDPHRESQKYWRIIKNLPNVYVIPPTQNRNFVHKLVKTFDIAIIPYDVSQDFNKHCFPMKFMEYAYVGVPILSTRILQLQKFPDIVTTSNKDAEWIHYIQRVPKISEKIKKKYRILATVNSWEEKVLKILENIQ